MRQKVKILLPCYNEEQNLPKLLGRINSLAEQMPYIDLQVLIVNDGSKDNTLKVAHDFQMSIPKEVLDVNPNKGLANAMREGLKTAAKDLNDNDIVIPMDGDDSHNPFLMERMIKQINEGSDVVIASRFQKGSRVHGLTKFREFTGWAAGMMFRVFIPIKGVKDFTCGYRAYKIEILRKADSKFGDKFIEEQGFACMAEIIIKLGKIGAIVHEMPMILRYDRKIGDSKMNVSRTIKQTLKLIAKHAVSK
ncbi:MAG: glycosyltransferase [Bacteroidetes bacterium]|nr:glycosyltransferase [Bacteroidota bacterium]